MKENNKEKIQLETAKLVNEYLKTPAGKQGATPNKIAELRNKAELTIKRGAR